jgi:hypothetical protein
MSTTLSKDIRLIVRDALLAGWDASQAAGYDPSLTPDDADWLPMSRGWYSTDPRKLSVSITNAEESPLGGGATGFTAFRGDGSGMNQDLNGTVLVTAFAEEDGDYNGGLSAADVVETVKSEVERAGNTDQTGPGELRYLAPQGSVEADDTDVTPPVRIRQATLGYGWQRTPP